VIILHFEKNSNAFYTSGNIAKGNGAERLDNFVCSSTMNSDRCLPHAYSNAPHIARLPRLINIFSSINKSWNHVFRQGCNPDEPLLWSAAEIPRSIV